MDFTPKLIVTKLPECGGSATVAGDSHRCCIDHGRIDRSGISRGGGYSLFVVRMFHIFPTDSANIE